MSTGINTNTKIDAKYLGSKIAADLRQLQVLYGEPINSHIDSYVDEFKTKFRIGDYLNAIIINNHHEQNKDIVGVVGRLNRYSIDYENKRLRIYVISDTDNQLYEVYPETIVNKDRIQENLMIKLKKRYTAL